MPQLLEGSLANKETIRFLANAVKHNREALLQLLLSLRKSQTLNRIIRCPTYPVRIVTPDLKERVQIFNDIIASDPYEISNVLAILYESATEKKYRKKFGQYFTPPQVAKEAVELLALKCGETVLDPGCGTGIFALAMLRNLAKKSKDAETVTYLGIENEAFLALSTAISLDCVDAPRSWRVLYANFLCVDDEALDKEINLPRVDTIIANPPFVRFHRLGERNDLTNKLGLSLFAGLHSFFLAHSSRILQNGRMVFVLPPEIYETNYGSDLMENLKRGCELSKKGIYYDRQVRTFRVEDIKTNTLEKHPKTELVATLALFQPISKAKISKSYAAKGTLKQIYVPLSFLASIHRGISTGANDFFVLTDESVRKIGIPFKYLKKVIPPKTKKELLTEIFEEVIWDRLRDSGKPCWLLCLPSEIQIDDLPMEVKQYIRNGERRGIHLVPTCMNRKPWYHIKIPQIPDLVFTYISRGYPKFIYNKARAFNLTNLLGIYLELPRNYVGDKIGDVVRLLNNDLKNWIDEEQVGRKYAGGLLKFEPKDLENLPISKSVLSTLGVKSFDSYLKPE